MKKLLSVIIAISIALTLSAAASSKSNNDIEITYQDDGSVIVGIQKNNIPTGWCAIYLTDEYEGCAFWGYFEDNKSSGNLHLADGTSIPATYADGILTIARKDVNEADVPEMVDEDVVTMGMKNALKSAEQYLSVMPFSYSGLIKQLEFSQYTHDEAVYAADHCGANWNEQAVKSAEQYLSIMAFSRSGLIDQLEYSGFTHSQAEYAVTQCGY